MQSVISVENLSKDYRLGVIGHGTLKGDLQSWWARIRGKEDPNAPIFTQQRKHGDHFKALQGVSFEVPAGQRLGVIGRNGAGKSTLLKILSRVTTPSSGQVRIRGRVASLLEVGTGFHPELTGRENVFLNGTILGMRTDEVKQKFDEIVAFAGVEDFVDTPVKRYSSGMHVRLGFAVAAHLEPDILIVDEVLAVGDAEFQKKCLGKMEEVSESQGRTVIFVSHNLKAVKELCERCILLDDGRVLGEGEPASVVETYLGGARASSVGRDRSALYATPDSSCEMQIMAAELQDSSGNRAAEFVAGETPSLCVDYEVRQPLSGMSITFELMRHGDLVLVHNDCDDWPAPLETRNPGRYRTKVRLPDFLNPGRYTFSKLLVNRLVKNSTNHSVRLDVHEGVLPFEILPREGVPNFLSYGGVGGGPVRSQASWELTRLDLEG